MMLQIKHNIPTKLMIWLKKNSLKMLGEAGIGWWEGSSCSTEGCGNAVKIKEIDKTKWVGKQILLGNCLHAALLCLSSSDCCLVEWLPIPFCYLQNTSRVVISWLWVILRNALLIIGFGPRGCRRRVCVMCERILTGFMVTDDMSSLLGELKYLDINWMKVN